MAARGTFDKKRAQAHALFNKGLSCRAIATELNVSTSTVSRWAKAEGLSFVARSQTKTAALVREFDMLAARARLAEKMTANADKALDSLDKPFTVFNFGGKDNTFASHVLDEAPLSARREAQSLSGIAFDKLSKVLEKTNDGIGRAESLVDHLEAFFDSIPDEPATDDGE